MSSILRWIVIGAVGWLLSAETSWGAWPPRDDATPEAMAEALFAEVRSIALKDADPVRRAWAWRALGAADDPDRIAMLAVGMVDPSPWVRVEVIESVRYFADTNREGADEARRVLAAAVADPSPDVRRSAADVLAKMFQVKPLWSGLGLAAGISDEMYDVRSACVGRLQLAKNVDPLAVVELRQGLEAAVATGSPRVQRWALGRLRYFDDVKRGTVKGGQEPDRWRVRLATIPAAAESKDWRVRLEAIRYATKSDPKAELRLCLDDPDSRVRAAGLGGVVGYAQAEVVGKRVKQLLADPDPWVARQAVLAAMKCDVSLRGQVDRQRDLVADDDLERAAVAAEVLLLCDSVWPLAWDAYRRAPEVWERFQKSLPGSAERRGASLQLAPALERLIADVDYDFKHERGSRRHREPEKRRSDARAVRLDGQAAAVIEGLPLAFDDPDPGVRFGVLRAAFIVWEWREFAQGPLPNGSVELWRRWISRADDEHVGVRREVARAFSTISRLAAADAELEAAIGASLDAAIQRGLHDADPAVVRSALLTRGRRAKPDALPGLRALVAESDDEFKSSDPTEWAQATDLACEAASILLCEHTSSLSPEELASLLVVCDRGTSMRSAGENLTPTLPALFARLLEGDRLAALWPALDRLSPFGRSVAVRKLVEAGAAFDAADRAALLEWLSRDGEAPNRCKQSAIEALWGEAEATPHHAELAKSFTEWAKAAAGRPGGRYAAAGVAAVSSPAAGRCTLNEPVIAATFASDDATAALLVFERIRWAAWRAAVRNEPDLLLSMPRPAGESPRGAKLVQEALRRGKATQAEQAARAGQPGTL
ncbi:MAG TPA: HEAT repeat domain-containing protein [Pirellulales bacterium]